MSDYTSQQNLLIIKLACKRMLSDKYNVVLTDVKLEELIRKISNLVIQEFRDNVNNMGVNELNTITLSKIKQIFQKYQEKEAQEQIQSKETQVKYTESIDEDMIKRIGENTFCRTCLF
jgi:Sec-independent protein translocase protein TatA